MGNYEQDCWCTVQLQKTFFSNGNGTSHMATFKAQTGNFSVRPAAEWDVPHLPKKAIFCTPAAPPPDNGTCTQKKMTSQERQVLSLSTALLHHVPSVVTGFAHSRQFNPAAHRGQAGSTVKPMFASPKRLPTSFRAHARLAGDTAWAHTGAPKMLVNFAVCKTVSSDSQKLIAHQEKSNASQKRPPFGRGPSDNERVHVATRHGTWDNARTNYY
ncbi:hypothetical protein FB451DRAFT_1163914 [Mycena latifolia]|nr:hypothetical protein FB451DRAFT_1163914 [Mycena latifolia]